MTDAHPFSTSSLPSPNKSFSKPTSSRGTSKSESNAYGSKTRYRRDGAAALPDEKRLLHPYDLSQRLRKICNEGKVEEALEVLKTSPLAAQTSPVWNTMLFLVLRAQKYKLGYQVYIDMKRRGLSPNSRTYTTVLSALSNIDDWEKYSKQLENACKVYEDFTEYIDALKQKAPDHPDINTSPINAYLMVLAKAHRYQELFDVYNAMDTHGRLAPDQVTFSIMLNAIRWRREQPPDSKMPVELQNASDARLLWKQILRAEHVPIDSFIIAPLIPIFRFGSPSDQILVFDIIREYLGLSKPGQEPVAGKIPLDARLLNMVLETCIHTQKPRLASHWMRQIMDKKLQPNEKTVLDRSHIDKLIVAYGQLAITGSMNETQQVLDALDWAVRESVAQSRPELRPTIKTYFLAMTVCWRCTDWEAAMRVFELSSGYRGADFEDGVARKPQKTERPEGLNLIPNNPLLSLLARTAVATQDVRKMRQCMRILTLYGLEYLMVATGGHEHVEHADFYAYKTAEAIARMVEKVLPRGQTVEEVRSEEASRWVTMRAKAREVLSQLQSKEKPVLPPWEEDSLGTMRQLAETEAEIDRMHTARTSAPNKRLY